MPRQDVRWREAFLFQVPPQLFNDGHAIARRFDDQAVVVAWAVIGIYGGARCDRIDHLVRLVQRCAEAVFKDHHGFSDQMGADDEAIDPSAAIRFFQKNPTFSASKLNYLRIYEAFTLLRQVREDVAKKTAAEIDVHLAEIKALHYALAQFMDDIGYQGVSSTFLRRWDDPV
jgi:hypothetical protein